MTRPFIPFPIFPPYSHWRPKCETSFPVNLQVSARLSEVNESGQPFIGTWYADRFINWIAYNWSPLNPHQQYNICTQGLEKMLNWSFANNRCLLDWTRADFENYSAFIINPTSVWVTSSKQTRFLGSPAMDFRIWLEAHPKNGSSVPLPPVFGRAFDRYLTYLNIDPRQPLPASFLFPNEHSTSAHALRSLWRMTCSIRESLADLATTSDNLNIAQAADDIRRLTASMVSNPLLGKSEP